MAPKKNKKTVYLPTWLIGIFDVEASHYFGPGVLIGAALYHFSQCSNEEKAEILEKYRIREIKETYELNEIPPEVQSKMDQVVSESKAQAEARKGSKAHRSKDAGNAGKSK